MDCYIREIENPKEVNNRRKEVGIQETIEDYVKRNGYKYEQ
jgi:hypothetical protein